MLRRRAVRGLVRFCLYCALVAVTPCAVAATITFEEAIAFPGSVLQQYCAQGVEFIVPARIVTPSVATASATHALTDEFVGQEFHEPDLLRIGFSTAQGSVSIRAGLDRVYGDTVTARLWGFSSPTPDPAHLVDIVTASLGRGTTSISTLLTVTSSPATIRSVMVEFFMPGNLSAYEWIDDLTFTAGPSCGTVDTTAPVVQINEPATPSQTLYSAGFLLVFAATDTTTDTSRAASDTTSATANAAAETATGIAKIDVSFLNISRAVLESFSVCGSQNLPPCPRTSTLSYAFNTFVPRTLAAGTHPILLRVEAWDHAGNRGVAERGVIYQAFGPNVNVWPGGMTITQGVQPWLARNNTNQASSPPTFKYPFAPAAVPLVSRRTTVVRVLPQIEGTGGNPVDNVTAALRCYIDAAYTTPCSGKAKIEPTEITSAGAVPKSSKFIQVGPTLDVDSLRQFSAGGWNFRLPAQWVDTGEIYLETEVIPPAGLKECSGCDGNANRLRIAGIRFREVPDFHRNLSRVGALTRDGTKKPTIAEVKSHLRLIRKLYPVEDSKVVNLFFTWTYDDKGGAVSTADVSACKKLINAMDGGISKQGRRTILLITDSQTPKLCSGLGRTNGHVVSRGDVPGSSAHEVGHGFTLLHAGPPPGHGGECAQSGFCDGDWPWPHGTTGSFGFDVLDFVGKKPGTTESDQHDIMSYGSPNWISSRTWTRLFNGFTGLNVPYPKPSAAVAATELAGLRRYLLVRGEADASGDWTLLPAYEQELSVGTSDAVGSGEYSVQILDSTGGLLTSRQFSISPEHVDLDDTTAGTVLPSFVEHVPLPHEATTVVLQRGNEVLATSTRTAAVPEVTLSSPDAEGFVGQPDEASIVWSGADTDGDSLVYMVQYSREPLVEGDPREWETLAIDLLEPSLNVDLAALPGSSGAMVRVLATDGFNTVVTQSPRFEVVGKPTTTEIFYPETGTAFRERQRAVFRGTGADREDGLLDPAALSWHSGIDGLLGSGYVLETESLSPGVHEITPQGVDRDGLLGTETVVVDVLAHINSQPVASAGPDRVMLTGDEVTLDGTGSHDVDGDTLFFAWIFVRQPPGSTPVFTNANSPNAGVITFQDGEYEIELVVNDGTVGSVIDTVTVESVGPSTDTDADGLTDQRELVHGLDRLNDDAKLDPDGDGFSNLAEFHRGTDPRNPASRPVFPVVQPLTTLTTNQRHPAIVYGGDIDRYFTIWEDELPNVYRRILGRRLDPTGSEIGGELIVGSGGTDQRLAADVAYNAANQEFLVVWQYEFSRVDHDIYAQRIDADGTTIGAQIPVATAVSFESNPVVAYDATAKGFLVVWEQQTGSGEFVQDNLRGRLLDGTGEPLQPAFDIASGPLDESVPAIARGEAVDRYLVVWQATQTSFVDYDIVGQMVDGEGVLQGGQIPVVTWGNDQLVPRAAFNENSKEFLVVWEDHHWGFGQDSDIYARRVLSEGSGAGDHFRVAVESSNHRLSPDVAYNRSADEFIGVWEYEFSTTDHDVYLRRLAGDGELLDNEVVVSNRASNEIHPALTSNGGDMFVIVWEDDRNEATGGVDLFSATVAVPVGTVEICDGLDNDLDGEVDEAFSNTDGDEAADCVDPDDDNDGILDEVELDEGSNPLLFTSTPEICDFADNDLDGQTDEGFDLDGDGFKTCEGDCNDSNRFINPAMTEACDGVDNNCHTSVDEGFDADADGFTVCAGDCADLEPLANPAGLEICDLIDNNCDGVSDEGFDADFDSTGDCLDGCPFDAEKVEPGGMRLWGFRAGYGC